jgi:hypothetical protein
MGEKSPYNPPIESKEINMTTTRKTTGTVKTIKTKPTKTPRRNKIHPRKSK